MYSLVTIGTCIGWLPLENVQFGYHQDLCCLKWGFMYRLVTIEICIGWLPQGFLYSLVTIMYNMVTIGICIPFSLLIFVQFSIHWVLYTFFSSVYRLVLGSHCLISNFYAKGNNTFRLSSDPNTKQLCRFCLYLKSDVF